ncbi:MAG TPA: helix-turn-helix transcriptional regulator [Chloroflexota bacterium]|nr:helix-turn-helix transcriptional regulator [Chloroflexota bacterium]
MSIGAPPREPREAVQFGRGAQSYILVILAQGRSYGYQIRQRLEDEFGYEKAAADPGALYRLLREMEAAHFIESTWDIAETGPARRYYQLTDAGREQLRLSADRLHRQTKRIERFMELYAEVGA